MVTMGATSTGAERREAQQVAAEPVWQTVVWDDPVIDGARMEAVFGDKTQPAITWAEPVVEGAAGSLYCTIAGRLADTAAP